VIITLNSGEHCLMVGAAGCGKGEVAYQAAEALGIRFLTLAGSLSPQTPVSSIIGYMNSAGTYVSTTFRDAFENGGLIFLDELDNAHPACVAAVNAALAIRPGQEIGFPDGMVKRSEDVPFICLAAANTFGRGPDRTYAARQRGDAATWDRFSILSMVYDHALEDVLCRRSGLEDDKCVEIIRYVRGLRMNIEKHQLPHVIGMRASIAVCKLVKAGMDLDTALDMRCRRGTSDQDWAKISGDVRKIDFETNWASTMRNRPGTGVATTNNTKPHFPDSAANLPPAVLDLIRQKKNIDAIKKLRDETSMPLVQAKNLVTKVAKAYAAGDEIMTLTVEPVDA
jgi:cobaltochelatase CobS